MRFFPIVLIVIGVVFLLRNLGVIPHDLGHTWWPLILIGVGVAAFFCGRRRCHDEARSAGKLSDTDKPAET